MQHLQLRFLIGLRMESNDDCENTPDRIERRARTALAILSRNYPCLGSTRGVGYWKGRPEPSLTAETLVEVQDKYVRDPSGEWQETDTTEERRISRARSVAGEIARALGQEAVGLTWARLDFTLVGPFAGDVR